MQLPLDQVSSCLLKSADASQVFSTEKELVIVQSYASGGALEDRLKLSGPLDEFTARNLFKQIVEGVQYCHKRVHPLLPLRFASLPGSHPRGSHS